MFKKTILASLIGFTIQLSAQDTDLLALVNEPDAANETVFATFKTTKIINAQSIETVKKRCLDFRITHRFSDMGVMNSPHTMWGFDISSDIRYSLDYGVTDKLTLGLARSKVNELVEGYTKWRFLEQTTNNKVPVSIALYGSVGYSSQSTSAIYSGVDPAYKHNEAHRFSYFSQLIIARKFNSWFSLQIISSYQHRNFIKYAINTANNALETNGIVSAGIGGRIRFTKRMALLVDYFYNFSPYRQNNKENPFYNPLAIGFEWETGGHVFHLNFTNNGAISENNFIPNTTSNWLDGQFKFGFNISRVFAF